MALFEQTLFGDIDLVEESLWWIRQQEPPEGYFLAFSGGKDSIVIKRLADMAGVKYDAHYRVTTLDPPDLIYFIRKHHPDVIWDRPEQSYCSMLLDPAQGFPPLRWKRWCCKLLKETGGRGRKILTGIRWAESVRRKQREIVEACQRDGTTKFLHPIIKWSNADVWEFIRAEKLPYCRLYDEGWKRIGCLMCPAASSWMRRRDAARYPGYARQFKRWFQKLIDKRAGTDKPLSWKTGEELFKWWIAGKRHPHRDDAQCRMFE